MEGPSIFSARSGESGSPTRGGVLAGEDKAFIWEKAWPLSSPPSDWSSAEVCQCSVANYTKLHKEHTVDTLTVRVQFWWPKPGRYFTGFQSEHVYRNVFDPPRLVRELHWATGPATPETRFWLFCRVDIHGDRGSGGRCKSTLAGTGTVQPNLNSEYILSHPFELEKCRLPTCFLAFLLAL